MASPEQPSSWLSAGPGRVRCALKVTPRAARSGVDGLEADAEGRAWLAVRVAAPPEDGKANAAVIKLLARRWGVRARDLQIVSGASARRKVLQLEGPAEQLWARLSAIEGRPRARSAVKPG